MELDNKQFEFIKPLTWKEVFKVWKGNEINESHWQEYYKKEGFKSWLGWRNKYLKPIGALNRKWKLIKVINPLKSVPDFHGGPYEGWTKNFYKGKNLPKFIEMKEHPRAENYFKNLPSKTTIIAWNTKIGIVIIEGMHRCAAIARAVKRGRKNLKLDLYVALADCPLGRIPDFREKEKTDKK